MKTQKNQELTEALQAARAAMDAFIDGKEGDGTWETYRRAEHAVGLIMNEPGKPDGKEGAGDKIYLGVNMAAIGVPTLWLLVESIKTLLS